MSSRQHRLKRIVRTMLMAAPFVCVLLAIGLLLFAGRGVIRDKLLPAYAQSRHAKQLEVTQAEQVNLINQYSPAIGLKFNYQPSAKCILDIGEMWRTSIYCSDEVDATLSETTNLPGDNPALQKLNQALLSRGWDNGNNKDNTWIDYSKTIDGLICDLQILQNTPPETLRGRIFCSRHYNYFGDPYNAL